VTVGGLARLWLDGLDGLGVAWCGLSPPRASSATNCNACGKNVSELLFIKV